ncbi:hypothetical protein [Marinoscillum sp.]|uniref:hypothetical protein n=1 Tax=Marinoscillum sp. TaxID=2024838 RepID=UPI003BA92524
MKTLKLLVFVWVAIACSYCEPVVDDPVELYTIPKGKHYSSYKAEFLQSDILRFEVAFDESAIYTTETEENQWDTNKLLGFADCNSHHHENSVRFGWRWLDGKIDILAYCYVNGERIIEQIGSTQPNHTNSYEIRLTDTEYQLTMDDKTISIARSKPCDTGSYYMLFPYFGGDETAPHDITISIRRRY